MTLQSEISERQRKAAFKAWETIRQKRREAGKSQSPRENFTKTASRKRLKAVDYPPQWSDVVAEVLERATNADGRQQCECCGECGKHQGRCEEINGTWAQYRRRKGKVAIRLTTAHLCHTPKCDDKLHLRAMCEPCHLIYDLRCRQRGLRGEQAVAWARGRMEAD